MKSILFQAIILLVLGARASTSIADGLPYAIEASGARRMFTDFIALGISDRQTTEISATGVVTFDADRLKKLRALFPKFPERAGVATSTFNDGREQFDPSADVIWWYANEIRVTIPKVETGESVDLPYAEPWTGDEQTMFRLAPDGRIFHQGKLVTIKHAIESIDEMAAKPKPQKGEERRNQIIEPPPFAEQYVRADDDVVKQLPQEMANSWANEVARYVYNMLTTYARIKGVPLYHSW